MGREIVFVLKSRVARMSKHSRSRGLFGGSCKSRRPSGDDGFSRPVSPSCNISCLLLVQAPAIVEEANAYCVLHGSLIRQPFDNCDKLCGLIASEVFTESSEDRGQIEAAVLLIVTEVLRSREKVPRVCFELFLNAIGNSVQSVSRLCTEALSRRCLQH